MADAAEGMSPEMKSAVLLLYLNLSAFLASDSSAVAGTSVTEFVEAFKPAFTQFESISDAERDVAFNSIASLFPGALSRFRELVAKGRLSGRWPLPGCEPLLNSGSGYAAVPSPLPAPPPPGGLDLPVPQQPSPPDLPAPQTLLPVAVASALSVPIQQGSPELALVPSVVTPAFGDRGVPHSVSSPDVSGPPLVQALTPEAKEALHRAARSLASNLARDTMRLAMLLAYIEEHRLHAPAFAKMKDYAASVFGREAASLKVTLRAGRTAWRCAPTVCAAVLEELATGAQTSRVPELPRQVTFVALARVLEVTPTSHHPDLIAKTMSKEYDAKALKEYEVAARAQKSKQPPFSVRTKPVSQSAPALAAPATNLPSLADVLVGLERAIGELGSLQTQADPPTYEKLVQLVDRLCEVTTRLGST